VLIDGPVRLRPLAMADGPAWRELKDRNRAWLSRWEATIPPGDEGGRINYRQMVRRLRSEALAARMLPFAIDYAEPAEGLDDEGSGARRRRARDGDGSLGASSGSGGIGGIDDDVEVDVATGMATARPAAGPGQRSSSGWSSDTTSPSGSSPGGTSPSGTSSSAASPDPSDEGLQQGPQHGAHPAPHQPLSAHVPHLPHRVRHGARPAYRLVGQLTVSSITWGSLRSANVGYWIDEAYAGRDITPTAVALAVDHCFQVCRLHRVEVCIRPENTPSLRVVEKLGFRSEGLREAYLHIDGGWRDHTTFALTQEEVPEGVLDRWHTRRSPLRGS
jgi:ribosomal-protein-alanine N-acetyltransferase